MPNTVAPPSTTLLSLELVYIFVLAKTLDVYFPSINTCTSNHRVQCILLKQLIWISLV